MDERRFDDLSRAVGQLLTRRALAAGVIGAFAASRLGGGADARANRRRRRGAMPAGWPCQQDGDCTAGLTCQNPSGGLGGACKPPGIGGQCQASGERCADEDACCGTLQCREGHCLPRVAAVGQRCRSEVDCGHGTCRRGRCACPDGLLVCGDACLDPATDAANCGSCGNACPAGSWCAAGSCAPVPDPCGGPCPVGQACVDGACVETPEDGEITQADGAACGFAVNGWYCHGWAVGYVPVAVNATLFGPVYVAGRRCWSDEYQVDCPICAWTGNATLFCPGVTPTLEQAVARGCARSVDSEVRECLPEHCLAGQTLCAGECVDLSTTPDHCGACGNVCKGADRTELVCDGGQCVPPIACPPGQAVCRGTNHCTDLQSDPGNCGRCESSCGNRCCVAGMCHRCF